MTIPDRIRWAVDVLDPQPADRIIEVGGGPGASAELICARLETGVLVAVDRSASAIARSGRRNAMHVADGRLRHIHSTLDNLEWDGPPFDAFLCVNLNLFWTTDATPELDVLTRVMKPGGRLLILYDANAPSAGPARMQQIARTLTNAGFTGPTVIAGDGGIGVRATMPARQVLRLS